MITRRSLACSAAALCCPFIRPARALGAPRRLRLGLSRPLATSHGTAARAMADGIAAATGGRYVVEVFSDAILGDDATLAASIQAATVDIAIHPAANLATTVPEVGVLDVPFLFPTAGHARMALDGEEGRALAELATAKGNAAILAWPENGFRHLTGQRPFPRASDLRGVKMRVLDTPALVGAFSALGVRTVAMPLVEVYEGLRIGQIEAEENSPQLIISNHLNEVQSHATLTAHAYTALCLAISGDLAEDLSPSDRAVFQDVARQAARRSREYAASKEASLIELMRSKGMVVVAEYDRASYVDALAGTRQAAAAQFGADRLARLASGAG